MNLIFKEYGSFLIYVLVAIVLIGTLLFGVFSKGWGSIDIDDQSTSVSAAFTSSASGSLPQLELSDCKVKKGTSFDVYSIIQAADETDGTDITPRIKMKELSAGTSRLSVKPDGRYSFSTTTIGMSIIEISLTNVEGLTQSEIACITVYSNKT